MYHEYHPWDNVITEKEINLVRQIQLNISDNERKLLNLLLFSICFDWKMLEKITGCCELKQMKENVSELIPLPTVEKICDSAEFAVKLDLLSSTVGLLIPHEVFEKYGRLQNCSDPHVLWNFSFAVYHRYLSFRVKSNCFDISQIDLLLNSSCSEHRVMGIKLLNCCSIPFGSRVEGFTKCLDVGEDEFLTVWYCLNYFVLANKVPNTDFIAECKESSFLQVLERRLRKFDRKPTRSRRLKEEVRGRWDDFEKLKKILELA